MRTRRSVVPTSVLRVAAVVFCRLTLRVVVAQPTVVTEAAVPVATAPAADDWTFTAVLRFGDVSRPDDCSEGASGSCWLPKSR